MQKVAHYELLAQPNRDILVKILISDHLRPIQVFRAISPNILCHPKSND